MNTAPEKPNHRQPCNGCGYCCASELCVAAEIALGPVSAPCPLMVFQDERFWCGLVLREKDQGMTPMIATSLGIGSGCLVENITINEERVMGRMVSWFSCGAASAIATKLLLSEIDVIAYCETGSEDQDNHRFMLDCQGWFGKEITTIKSKQFDSTWDVWEKRRYISGIAGAPCTQELKIKPRLAFQRPDDIHVFGYTADSNDVRRAVALRENWPELTIETPLIDRGINKASCLAMIEKAGINPPRVYAMGFPNANCIPCCKATSAEYYALTRKTHPNEFNRLAELSRGLGARLARINGERIFLDEIPEGHPTTQPIAPECDFLCQLAEQEI